MRLDLLRPTVRALSWRSNQSSGTSPPVQYPFLVKRMSLTRSRMIVAAASVLWLVHIAACIALGSRSPGPLLSDLIQFILGALLIAAMMLAANRSHGMARAFWRLTTSAYVLLLSAQGLSVYNDLARTSAATAICFSRRLM